MTLLKDSCLYSLCAKVIRLGCQLLQLFLTTSMTNGRLSEYMLYIGSHKIHEQNQPNFILWGLS